MPMTLNGTTGIVLPTAAAPAFSAYKSTNQTVSSGTWTKITFDSEDFDTNNNFASSTFTPTVAGYYQFNIAASGYSNSTNTNLQVGLYKNGSLYRTGGIAASAGQGANFIFSGVVYLNGSTDYIEAYVYSDSQSATVLGAASNARTASTFSGAMIRSA